MTQDEIIEIAEEAGMTRDGDMWFTNGESDMDVHIDQLESFAKLVADKERNRLADELQKMPLNDTANSIAIWIRGQE